MQHLDKLIQRILNPTRVANEDAFDTVKEYWDDVTNGYWNDVDEELADELGVTPVALAELLEVHRHTFTYANVGGNSSVRGYDHGEDWLVVMFSDGSRYLYTLKSTSRESLDYMRQLAHSGKGLNSYLTRLVGTNYAGKNIKGNILIKPGMEQFNPIGFKRLKLIEAFRNTMEHQVSNELFKHDTLNKYKVQLEQAGRDGLDQTACQIMTVGLETMGYGKRVSNESYDSPVSETNQLSEAINSALTGSTEGFWDTIKDFFAGRPTRAEMRGSDSNLIRSLKSTILDPIWLDRQTFSEGDVEFYGLQSFNGDYRRASRDVIAGLDRTASHNQREAAKLTHILKPAIKLLRSYQYDHIPNESIQAAIDMLNPYRLANIQIKFMEPVLMNDDMVDTTLPALDKNSVMVYAKELVQLRSALDQFIGIVTFKSMIPNVTNVSRLDHMHDEAKKAMMKRLINALSNARTYLGQIYQRSTEKHSAWVNVENLADTYISYIAKSMSNITLKQTIRHHYNTSHEAFSNESILDSIKKFFTPGKDKEIYQKANGGFLYQLRTELEKKYANASWVRTKGTVTEPIEINGVNFVGPKGNQVVDAYIKQSLELRKPHKEALEKLFDLADSVISAVGSGKINNQEVYTSLSNAMKEAKRYKQERPTLPSDKPVAGKVKPLNEAGVVDEAKRIMAVFDALNADTTFVDRWNKTIRIGGEWQKWKYVNTDGKAMIDKFDNKDIGRKFQDRWESFIEYVYDNMRVGVEAHGIKDYIVAGFMHMEKSIKD